MFAFLDTSYISPSPCRRGSLPPHLHAPGPFAQDFLQAESCPLRSLMFFCIFFRRSTVTILSQADHLPFYVSPSLSKAFDPVLNFLRRLPFCAFYARGFPLASFFMDFFFFSFLRYVDLFRQSPALGPSTSSFQRSGRRLS